MGIVVADTAGFCFGVNRAVNMVNKLLAAGKKVYTLGPIIHNKQMVDELASQGVEIAEKPEDVTNGATLVIRSHGVPLDVIDRINLLKLDYADATCPFVSKIHKIVNEASKKGKRVLIAGDENHPDVEGIRGNCISESYVFKNLDELKKLVKSNNFDNNMDTIIVAQTTFSVEEWQNCLNFFKKVCTNATIFDTICNATSDRQKEAEKLSKSSDLMIVIGGRHSSNTVKLKDICEKNCKTFLIETADELPLNALKEASCIGITAGASTPAIIIKEVLKTMSDVLDSNEVNEEDNNENFEEMLEESLKNLNTDDKVHGVVVGISPNEVYVDVGRKQAGFIPANELSSDPNAKIEDLVKVGDEMDLLIMRVNDQEGTIMLSKKRLDAIKGWEKIVEANEKGEKVKGTVLNVVRGGLIAVTSDGLRVFIPASQATDNRNEPLENLLKKEVEFKIIEVNKSRRRAVASIRAVLKDKKNELTQKFWETAEVGAHYKGTVRSLTSYGAFVDIGGIDGMIHISELSWSRIKHPSDVVKVGDIVDVYIKDLDKEHNKISLGYKREEDNPWVILKRDYPVGTIIDTEIVGLTSFGAFAKILPGIDGLIHISQIADKRVEKPQDELKIGQKVKAVITDIDFDKKRISLSMRKLLEKKEDSASSEE